MLDFLLLRITEEKWNGYVDKLLAKLKGMGEVKAMLILRRHTHFRKTDYEKLIPVLNDILNRFSANTSFRGTAYAILAEGAFAENDLGKFVDYGRNAYNYYTQLAAKKKFKTQAEACAVDIAAMKYMLTGEYQTALQVIDKVLAQNIEPLNRVVLTDKYLECQQRQGSPLREDYLSFMNAQPDMADTKKWKQIYREQSA